jgi:hypothetical protein
MMCLLVCLSLLFLFKLHVEISLLCDWSCLFSYVHFHEPSILKGYVEYKYKYKYIGNRLSMEALYIRSFTESIMNGCEGGNLLTFL